MGNMMCDHTFHSTLIWTQEQRIQPFWENIEKIVDLGGYGDCEVVMHRFRSLYPCVSQGLF